MGKLISVYVTLWENIEYDYKDVIVCRSRGALLMCLDTSMQLSNRYSIVSVGALSSSISPSGLRKSTKTDATFV